MQLKTKWEIYVYSVRLLGSKFLYIQLKEKFMPITKELALIKHTEDLLKTDERFADKNGKLFIPKILESIENIDLDLVQLLVNDATTKKHFFTTTKDFCILNQNKLIEFFTMNEYFKHSFTSYKNKIGLIKKDSFIKKFDDVVLAFPYKDCLLEGGQTKDNDKNSEVFYNSVISADEIDRLLEPKVFTNFKKFDKDGKHKVDEIKDDDNLIIKGNNLLALHSLKERYRGKVKLIYIDPPYNTGNDSFNYNDNFNHSTWLTFMKNRLEVAKEFLSDDGVIFVSIDDNEQAYLKVLMDEVFGNKNFLNTVTIMSNPRGRQSSKYFAETHEYGHIYGKNSINVTTNGEALTAVQKKEYNKSDKQGIYREIGLRLRGGRSTAEEAPTLHFPLYVDTINKQIYLEEVDNSVKIIPKFSNGTLGTWRWSKPKIKEDMNFLIAREVNRGGVKEFDIFQKDYLLESKTRKTKTTWIEKEINYDRSSQEQVELFGKKKFDYAKPTYLLKKIIGAFTNKNDIIMDFHAGSGTTAHAVLDINKEQNKNLKFILIEQMDYIKDITCKRVEKVIEKNQQGSFIYTELKKIENFKDAEIGSLNKNMQYLPMDEIEDEEYKISQEEIEINKKFYNV